MEIGKVEIGPAFGLKPKRASCEATIIRADGRIEHLGVVAHTEFTWCGKIARALTLLSKRIFG